MRRKHTHVLINIELNVLSEAAHDSISLAEVVICTFESFMYSLHFRVFYHHSSRSYILTFSMASTSNNGVQDEDYQLWDPREREDTRLGKKFLVRSNKINKAFEYLEY